MKARGFTLIELMVTVAIIAILSTIAYAAYNDSIIKGRRADARATLSNTAQALERCYTEFTAYNNAGCRVAFPFASPEGFYDITAANLTATTFTLTATPKGPQVKDTRCAAFTLDQLGTRGTTGTGTANDCW